MPNERTDESPRVSVIIPTYNRAHYMSRCINSVLNQTYQNFEIIVVDDASTDNTEEVVKSLGSDKIHYLKLPKNKKVAGARNEGIKIAKGEFIIPLDSDDEFLPEKLEKLVKRFDTAPENVGVVYSACWRIYDDINRKEYIPSPKINRKDIEGDVSKALFIWNNFLTPPSMVRKSVFEKVGCFNEKIPSLEDWNFWIRVSKHYHFAFVNEPLHILYFTPGCMLTEYDNIGAAAEMIYNEFYEDIKNDRKMVSSHCFFTGYYFLRGGNKEKARHYLYESLKNAPFKLKNIIFYIFSLTGRDFFEKVRGFKRRKNCTCPAQPTQR
jgi:glycosyltransferase involved in cell wall biosynthesis